MKKVAIVFPGQGSQYFKMLQDYYDEFEVFRNTFEEAKEILKFDIWDIIKNSEEKLKKTEYTQPAILTSSVAIWRIIENFYQKSNIQDRYSIEYFAGHSLGEYSALICSRAINFSDALKLIRKRAMLMKKVNKNNRFRMSAIIGLPEKEIEFFCKKTVKNGGIAEISNINSQNQIVISGDKESIEKVNIMAKEKGAKRTKILNVSGPSHCSIMKNIEIDFAQELKRVTINKPKVRVIHNFDLNSYSEEKYIKEALLKQLSSPVLWHQTIKKISRKNIDIFIECGPGTILTGLGKRILKSSIFLNSATVKAFEDIKSKFL